MQVNTAIVSMPVIFAAVSTGLLAIGLFARDLIAGRRPQTRGLAFEPRSYPAGRIDRWFQRLVVEAGGSMDYSGALALVVGGGIVGLAAGLAATESLLVAAGGLVLGAVLPVAGMSVVRWRRVGQMRKHLPTTLQIIADAVRAGHTLEEAFDMAAHETKGPLGAEFQHACSQFKLGHSPVAIVDRLLARIPLPEFRVFATAVLVHRRAGGNLSLLTERMARSARDRQEVRGHLLAVTAGSRLSAIGMVVGSMIAMAVLASLEPDYIGAFFTHELGPTLLVVAGCLQLVGVAWVWRVLRINY